MQYFSLKTKTKWFLHQRLAASTWWCAPLPPPYFTSCGPKWRGSFFERPDHPVTPNRLEFLFYFFV